jgi:hypothetical protein
MKRGKVAHTEAGGGGALRLLALIGLLAVFVARAEAVPYTFYDDELLNASEFVRERGGSLISRCALPDQGVQFTLTLAEYGDGKTDFGDSWPLSSKTRLNYDPGLGHWTSLAAYDSIQMNVRYASGPTDTSVDMLLFMNTGLCGPSGNPPNNWDNDTFWEGEWASIALGQMAVVKLDFNWARALNVSDNPVPHTQAPPGLGDGDFMAIDMRDRCEVSHLGFAVADFDEVIPLAGQPIVLELNIVPEPAACVLLCLGLAALLRPRR